MKYNLIIEGCDCTGKTSIITNLMYLIKWKHIMKMSAPIDYEDAKKINYETADLLNNNFGIILDRGLLGEEVYGPLKRGYKVDYMRELELSLEKHNILIVVTADLKVIKERFDGKFLNVDELEHVNNFYLDVFDKLNYNKKILVDTSDMSSIDCAKKIIKEIEE